MSSLKSMKASLAEEDGRDASGLKINKKHGIPKRNAMLFCHECPFQRAMHSMVDI